MYKVEGSIEQRLMPDRIVGEFGIYYKGDQNRRNYPNIYSLNHIIKHVGHAPLEQIHLEICKKRGLVPPDLQLEYIDSEEAAQKYCAPYESQVRAYRLRMPDPTEIAGKVVHRDSSLIAAHVTLSGVRFEPVSLDYNLENGWREVATESVRSDDDQMYQAQPTGVPAK